MSEEDYKAVGEIKNQWIETKDEYLDMALNVIDNLKIKNKQYNEVIQEVRELINFYETTEWGLRGYSILQKFRKTLDKVGDNNG